MKQSKNKLQHLIGMITISTISFYAFICLLSIIRFSTYGNSDPSQLVAKSARTEYNPFSDTTLVDKKISQLNP